MMHAWRFAMHRRRGIQIAAVAVLLLFGTLGTAGARQIWNDSQAHSAWISAQAAVGAQLQRARAEGMLPVELAPFIQARKQLESSPVPGENALWSSAQADFYSRQSDAYRALGRAVRREVTKVTRTTHEEAARKLATLRGDISRGEALAVNTTAAAGTLARARVALGASTTPGANRAVVSEVQSASSALAKQVASKQRRVDAIVSASGGTVTGIASSADATVSGVQGQLSLLGLFSSRASTYQTTLLKLAAAVHAQQVPRSAAVAEASLEDEAAAANADAAKTVPSKLIVVSTEQQTAWMYQDGAQVYTTPVTTGGPELPTDHGIFHIYLKETPFVFHSPWPPGSPYYYPPTPITYWMPFDGAEGLHDAWWRSNFGPGSNLQPTDLGTGNYILGTHGCVNMPMAAAQFVWDWAPVGTTVVVD
jgi:lipoprotein-anchoring transpeptidase ErfK/SrfK